MKQNKKSLKRTIILLVAGFCLFQSLTKGWGLFLYLPTALVTLPIYIGLQFQALKYGEGRFSKLITAAALLQTLAVLAFFTAPAGFGDTSEVLLLGFYKTDVHSTLTVISDQIAYFSRYVAAATTVLLLVLLIASDKPKAPRNK